MITNFFWNEINIYCREYKKKIKRNRWRLIKKIYDLSGVWLSCLDRLSMYKTIGYAQELTVYDHQQTSYHLRPLFQSHIPSSRKILHHTLPYITLLLLTVKLEAITSFYFFVNIISSIRYIHSIIYLNYLTVWFLSIWRK